MPKRSQEGYKPNTRKVAKEEKVDNFSNFIAFFRQKYAFVAPRGLNDGLVGHLASMEFSASEEEKTNIQKAFRSDTVYEIFRQEYEELKKFALQDGKERKMKKDKLDEFVGGYISHHAYRPTEIFYLSKKHPDEVIERLAKVLADWHPGVLEEAFHRGEFKDLSN